MKLLFVFCLLAFVAVNAQLDNKFSIDDFGNGANDQKVEITLSSTLEEGSTPIVGTSSESYPGCTGLVGCARDMEMRVFSGLNGRSFTSNIFSPAVDIFEGEWVISNPKTSTSIASLEYDGADGDFDGENNGGLGSVDVTVGGLGTTLRISAVTDLAATYDVFMFDNDGDVCEYNVEIEVTGNDYSLVDTFSDIELDESDDCDLTDIGYIRVSVASSDAVDAIVRSLTIVGPPNPSATPSPTRTPSPAASASNTPSPSSDPSQTRTPSSTPSVTPSPSFIPNAFTWYTFDDDDNGRSPCADEAPRKTYFIDDRNVIYYYFFGNEVVDEESASAASVLVAGLTLVAGVFLF